MSASKLRHSWPPSIMSATRANPAILTNVFTTVIDRFATLLFVLMDTVYTSQQVHVTTR